MRKFKPNLTPESHRQSSQLLNHIKDEQFYSTLSTITLQLAREAGVDKNVLDHLSECFSNVKGSSNNKFFSFEKQNNRNDKNITKTSDQTYNIYQKQMSIKQQINFVQKMQSQLTQSRQKQYVSNALQKYCMQKQLDLIPAFGSQTITKSSRFKSLLCRKRKSQTSQNYFKLNPLDLLKNIYEKENQCYKMLRGFTLLKTMFGHSMDDDLESSCPLYNVLFDQTGQLVISGGEEGAIKVWSRTTGLLLSSLKGHQEYINKLDVTKCNKYIYSTAGDGIRFFLLQDMSTLSGWKTQSIIDIAAIYDQESKRNKFMFGDRKNLYILEENRMLAKRQGCLQKSDFLIFKYSHKVIKQSFILNIQISPNNQYVLLGFESGDLILFHYKDLFTLQPIKQQTQPLSNVFNLPIRHYLRIHKDQIRELKWHISNQVFVSGGKQGYCLLWQYKNQKFPIVLKQLQVSKLFNRRKKRAFGCNFICFNCTYTHFVAGFMELVDQDDDDRGNGDVLVYNIQHKETVFQFSKDMPIKVASVRGMDTHPTYPNIAVVCEGTGRILLIDFIMKTIVNTFQLRGFHLLHPQFALNPADCRFSKDGKYFVVSTQFGSVSIFGYDLKVFYETCPVEQFFAQDFTAFTLNENMRPIPIQGDFQIDMNRINRGQIRNIRGEAYQNQLKCNFDQFWKQTNDFNKERGIQHKNSILRKDKNPQYVKYLNSLQKNIRQSQKQQNFYSKNVQQIQSSKQSLLYEQKQKQTKIFKKLMQQKVRKMKGQSLVDLTHDKILEQIDAKGKLGGRRLLKIGRDTSTAYPNYRDDNFDYDAVNQEQYQINQEDQIRELDYDVDGSDDIPRNTRSRINRSRFNHQPRRSNRYNIRERTQRNFNYADQQESEEQQKQQKNQNLKRRTPAQDIQDMLVNDEFKNYDMSQGRKKRKRNRNQISDSQGGQSQSYIKQERRNVSSSRRGRPKRISHPLLIESNSESPQQQNIKKLMHQSDQDQSNQKQYNLRTRNQNNSKSGSRKKEKELGECFRCAVKDATAQCHQCECTLCDTCKRSRGKETGVDTFTCFICIYVNIPRSAAAVTDQKKITEQNYRLNYRSQQIYVPQIDDEVRFFFQGYQQFLSHNIRLLNPTIPNQLPQYLLMPHIYNQIYGQTLLQTPLCRVKDIKYYFPFNNSDFLSANAFKRRSLNDKKQSIQMLINLQLIGKYQNIKEDQRNNFWVFFVPTTNNLQANNQYLLREQIYQYIESHQTLEKLEINQTVFIDNQQYQIVEKEPIQDCFPTSIWKQVKISKSDGKRLRNGSKDSQKRCNIWQITSLIPKMQYTSTLSPQLYEKKLVNKIKQIRLTIDNYQLYQDYIDFDILPQYRNMIEVGICLSSIEQRIQNNYYKSIKSLQFDLNLMVNDSVIFNGQDNDITEIGKNIRKQILISIGVEEKLNSNKKIVQHNTKQRKQTRNSKKVQTHSDALSYQEDDLLINISALRNQRNSRNLRNNEKQKVQTKIRKKQSQDYGVIDQSSQFQAQDIKIEQDQKISQVQYPVTRRNLRRSQKLQNSRSNSRLKNASKQRKQEKLIEDYNKQEQIIKNMKSRSRKDRYIDSSFESNQKNSNINGTRRSSRFHK